MQPLTDPERLKHYRFALSNWQCSGYVIYTRVAAEWLLSELGIGTREFSQLLWEHVVFREGRIDEVRETREEYTEHEFHHDLRLEIDGQMIYVETRLLMEPDIEDTAIQVVNVHDA